MSHASMESPIGPLLLAGTSVVSTVYFRERPASNVAVADWVEDENPFKEVIRQLGAYFAGKLTEFDLPLVLKGTEFQLTRVEVTCRKFRTGKRSAMGSWLSVSVTPMRRVPLVWRMAQIPSHYYSVPPRDRKQR